MRIMVKVCHTSGRASRVHKRTEVKACDNAGADRWDMEERSEIAEAVRRQSELACNSRGCCKPSIAHSDSHRRA